MRAAGNEHAADAAFHVLAGLTLQIAIQRLDATFKNSPVVVSSGQFDGETACRTHLEATRRSCSAKAGALFQAQVDSLVFSGVGSHVQLLNSGQ